MRLYVENLSFMALSVAVVYLFYMLENRPWMQLNLCNMTYMFRVPNFMIIDVESSISTDANNADAKYSFSNDFRSYSTILYGEGDYAYNFIETGHVSGIPVIFVPGNAGTSRQVRSLGSVLHNKTESRNLPFTFDVFAVDFNEELSGLSGMYLERQIKYLELAVKYIWHMYSPPPRGIIFVGHSMGGVIIRSLLRSPYFDPSQIAFIITLGTPHRETPIVFDWYIKNVYDRMHDSWRERENDLVNLLVLSISGGLKDHLVPERLTLDRGIEHISTTAIDGIELETDHQCIVWCNQLVRRISRLLIQYAYSPASFHDRAPSVVQQLFSADGLIRKMYRATVDTSNSITVKNDSLFIRNNDENVKEFLLSFSKNSWLFIARSSGSTLWKTSREPIYSLNTLQHSFYTLIQSSNATTTIAVQLKPQAFFKAVVLQEDSEDSLSSGQEVHIDFFSLLKGCFTSLWQADIDGRRSAVLLPIRFRSPAIAVLLSLELNSCNRTNEWFGKIDFRSRYQRRISSLVKSKKLHLIGYLLYKEEMKADAFFILNQRCSFNAHLDISYLDTLIVMFRMYATAIPYMMAIYILCALSISALVENSILQIQNHVMLFYSTICYVLIIYWNDVVDWFTLLISSLFISYFTYLLQKLANICIQIMQYSILNSAVKLNIWCKKLTVSYLGSTEIFIVVASSIINYTYNGYFALSITVFLSLLELMKTTMIPMSARLSCFCQPVLLTVLHFYVILVYAPFGICSIWNLKQYGLFTVYEDPARVPAYFLIFLKFVKFAMYRVHFCKMQYASLIVLAYTAMFQPSDCVARLGVPFIILIGLSWFVKLNREK